MSRILILGANGFLGRSIAHHLADRIDERDLVIHTRNGVEPSCALSALSERVEHHHLDLATADPITIGQLIDHVGPDAIVNCVGSVSGSPVQLHDANVDVVDRIARALVGRRQVHLVHLGSAAEYGLQEPLVPVREDVFAAPSSAYGMTKLRGTELLVAAALDRTISMTVLRVFNPLGRFSAPTTLPGRAAAVIEACLRDGDDTARFGPLDAWRDYIDTRDVADAVLAACDSRANTAPVVNVGRGIAVQSRELVRGLCAIAGFDGHIVEELPPSGRSDAVNWQAADMSRAERQLGWRATHDLDDALRDVWQGTISSMGATPR